MHWIADYWWVWLIGCVATMVVAIHNQIKRIKNMHSEAEFFKGIYILVGAGILNMVFSILLVVSIVLHIINYAKS